jgi:hypothetical protein
MKTIDNIMALIDEYAEVYAEGYDDSGAQSHKKEKALRTAIEAALSAKHGTPQTVSLQDIEQYRVQMAAISTAAIGYWKEGDGILPDYDTVPLRDVAKLYAKYDELYKQVHAHQPQREWVSLTDVEWMNIVNKNQAWFGMQPDEVAHEVCKLTEAKLREKNGGGRDDTALLRQALEAWEDQSMEGVSP